MRPPMKFEHIDEAMIHIPDADVSRVRRKWLDIPYANLSPAQKLDIYLPDEGDGQFPVLLIIHGGAFAIGHKREIHLEAWLQALERGYAVVSVDYRLSGEACFPAGIQDVKAAIRWLRAHSGEYHLDGRRIAAVGASSGANYASMICLTANKPEFEDASLGNAHLPSFVQAGVSWFGPTDFLKMDEQLAESGFGPCDHSLADSPESRYIGAKITDAPEKVRLANPITYIHADMPPLLLQHGRQDHLVPVQQSILFAQALASAGLMERFEFDILEKADHADPLFETPENMERVFMFLDQHLKG